MRKLFISLLFSAPLISVAQTNQMPPTMLKSLSKDLAELQQAVLAAQAQQQAETGAHEKIWAFPQKVTVTTSTYLRAGAAEKAATVILAEKGKTFPVLSQAGEWYAVGFDTPVNGMNSAWIKAAAAVPTGHEQTAQSSSSAADKVFETLTERAARFKQNYQNNPYVGVTGFSVNVLPPSVSINFEFKK